jgi:glycosyltransferase involved in cell wall biosynthesis
VTTISVVIPTYNNATGGYLRAAIDSALDQTFRDYDVVIVDDGSTDETAAIVAEYGTRLRYHYQANQGLAVARNTGLDLAGGIYVTYLDGDDTMHRDNLACKAALLARCPEIAGVFSDFEVFTDRGTVHASGIRPTFGVFARTGKSWADIFAEHVPLEVEGTSIDGYVGNIFDTLFEGNIILPSTMVFRRDWAKDVGYFVPELRTQQDYEFWLRFARRHPFGFLDRVLVRYRRHARQLTDKSNIIRVIETSAAIVDRYEQDFAARGEQARFNRRKAELLEKLAKAYLYKNRTREARRLLAESVRRHPGRISNQLYFLASLMPGPWLNAMYRTIGRRS